MQYAGNQKFKGTTGWGRKKIETAEAVLKRLQEINVQDRNLYVRVDVHVKAVPMQVCLHWYKHSFETIYPQCFSERNSVNVLFAETLLHVHLRVPRCIYSDSHCTRQDSSALLVDAVLGLPYNTKLLTNNV